MKSRGFWLFFGEIHPSFFPIKSRVSLGQGAVPAFFQKFSGQSRSHRPFHPAGRPVPAVVLNRWFRSSGVVFPKRGNPPQRGTPFCPADALGGPGVRWNPAEGMPRDCMSLTRFLHNFGRRPRKLCTKNFSFFTLLLTLGNRSTILCTRHQLCFSRK